MRAVLIRVKQMGLLPAEMPQYLLNRIAATKLPPPPVAPRQQNGANNVPLSQR